MLEQLGYNWLCSSQKLFVRFSSLNYAALTTLGIVKRCVEDSYRDGAVVLIDDSALRKLEGLEIVRRLAELGVLIVGLSEVGRRPSFDSDVCVIAAELPQLSIEKLWIAAFVSTKRRTLGGTSCIAKKIERKLVVICRGIGVACFEHRNGMIELGSCPKEVEALRVLERYQMEFGSLKVRDAVNAISLELGLGREEARRALGLLKYLGLICIRRGLVELRL